SSSFSRVSSLTSRKLKSFDRLRGFVPALQLPKNDESYNPSPVDHERALLISAVRTLEEQEALQKSQATKQQTSHASSLYTRDLRDLENLLLEKKSEMDAQKGDFSRYTRPVNAALTDIGLSPDTVLQLSSKQKQ
ncbi:nop53 (60s ribosomal biogenesis) protein, partial [Cystoisospora suis]